MKNSTRSEKKCVKIFARFGILSRIIVDNIPFNSIQFKIFANEWGIQLNNYNPNYPLSEVLLEKYVGMKENVT